MNELQERPARRAPGLRWLASGALMGLLTLPAVAEAPRVAVTIVNVSTHSEVPDLECPRARPPAPKPAASAASDAPVYEIPDEEMVQEELQSQAAEAAAEAAVASAPQPAAPRGARIGPGDATHRLWRPAARGEPFRVAVWGDSHLAAGFLTGELVSQLGLAADQVQSAYVPANMNRGGVRLPVRKTCVSPQWKYEPLYVSANIDGAAAPGPGLVNLSSSTPDASLAWDLRNAAGQPEARHAHLLYQQTTAPVTIGLSVDGGEEQRLVLGGAPGPASLDIAGDGPLSVLRVRLIEGAWRVHGLRTELRPRASLQMDVFGWPGATVAGWSKADPAWMSAWFAEARYQLVMMEFGTNEGNVKPFDAAVYRSQLGASVARMRATFPDAACLLIAPGDRGVLVPRSAKSKGRGKGKAGAKSTAASASKSAAGKTATKSTAKGKPAPKGRTKAPPVNLLQYSRIHEQIGRVQDEVAAQAGCRVWSMMDAMGGPASAYTWARAKPAPLMAPDLIHFTVAGYRRLGASLAKDIGWTAARLWE